MSPAALATTVELVARPIRELLEAHLPEHGIQFDDFLWIISTALIVEALKTARGNKSRAAKMLGMERNSLNFQIGERHLEPVVEKTLEAVKIAEHLQPTLFPLKKPSTPIHPFVLKFSSAASGGGRLMPID